MLYSLRDKFERRRFNRQIDGILNCPPTRLVLDSALGVLSQLQHKDVRMYLAAAKSFCHFVDVGAVHIVDDGSLTVDDRQILHQHVPGVTIHALSRFRRETLPAGGTWERLVAIAQLSESRYVIQLDADTLTQGPLPEVTASIQNNQAFTIGTWNDQIIEPARQTAARAKKNASVSSHVQLVAESLFDQIPDSANLKYVRGCSGFAGFPQGPGKLAFIQQLSGHIHQLIGKKWLEWGSEQVMSNLVVANEPSAIVLPHPAYSDCQKMEHGSTRFVHFIGTCRFKSGLYARAVNALLPRLLNA